MKKYFNLEEAIAPTIENAIREINHEKGRGANYRMIDEKVRQNPRFQFCSPETISRCARKMASKGILYKPTPGIFYSFIKTR